MASLMLMRMGSAGRAGAHQERIPTCAEGRAELTEMS
jgi:hypothetical protein